MKAKVAMVLLAVLLVVPATAKAAGIPPHVIVGKVRVQVRVDAPHSLGTCWQTPIKHIHVEIFRVMPNGRAAYMSNFHVGKSGACYVVFNNYKPYMCYRTCNGSTGLWGSLVAAARKVALVFGVTFTLAVILVIVTAAFGPAIAL
jgi:hypothetical protein